MIYLHLADTQLLEILRASLCEHFHLGENCLYCCCTSIWIVSFPNFVFPLQFNICLYNVLISELSRYQKILAYDFYLSLYILNLCNFLILCLSGLSTRSLWEIFLFGFARYWWCFSLLQKSTLSARSTIDNCPQYYRFVGRGFLWGHMTHFILVYFSGQWNSWSGKIECVCIVIFSGTYTYTFVYKLCCCHNNLCILISFGWTLQLC